MGIRRIDFRQVRPTDDERADWNIRHPNRRGSYPYRAEHKPCGVRIWYSGLAIVAHIQHCPARHQT